MAWLKHIISQLLRRHHPWRSIGYDELSELYIGMMFRSFALSIIGVFVPLYLLNLGYSVAEIITVFGWYFTFQIAAAYITARLIAAIGPKHTILLSYIVQIGMLVLFLTLPTFGWPIWLLGGVWGVANSLFWVSYHVDFSKIKHTEHGGKEVGVVNIVSRIGYAAGPVIGGVSATFFGAQYTFILAIIILFIGLIPLLSTAEPVKTHRKLTFGGFSFREVWRDTAMFVGACLDDLANSFFWPLFLSLFVVSSLGYADLGIISTVSMLVSVAAARIFGQWADRHHGRSLFQTGLLGAAMTYMVRPFISSVRGALGLSVLYELLIVGVNLPFYKGLYDRADDYDDRRIEFITILETIASVVRAMVCWTLVLLLGAFDVYTTISLVFVGVAITSCLTIAIERFKALD